MAYEYVNDNITINIQADKENVLTDDIINFSIKIFNNNKTDEVKIRNMKIVNILPNILEFIKNSVIINNKASYDTNIISGIKVEPPKPGYNIEILFKARVLLCDSKSVILKSICQYDYDDNESITSNIICSNVVELNINEVNVEITKSYEKKGLSLYEDTWCNVSIYNKGNIKIYNLCYKEVLSECIEICEDSFYEGEKIIKNPDLARGFFIESLNSKDVINIRYKIRLKNTCGENSVINESKVEYNYKSFEGKNICKTAILQKDDNPMLSINMMNFKENRLENYLYIQKNKARIKEINKINSSIDIIDYHIIDTVKSVSCEMQELSGYELIMKCCLNLIIQYISYDKTKAIYYEKYCFPFSTYIVLQKEYSIGMDVQPQCIIEDVYYEKVDDNCFFESILYLAVAKLPNNKKN